MKSRDVKVAVLIGGLLVPPPEVYFSDKVDHDAAFACAVIDIVRTVVGHAYRYFQKPGDHLYQPVQGSAAVRECVMSVFTAAGYEVFWVKDTDKIKIMIPDPNAKEEADADSGKSGPGSDGETPAVS